MKKPFECMSKCAQGTCRQPTVGCQWVCEVRREQEEKARNPVISLHVASENSEKRILELERKNAELDRAVSEVIAERDRAQDALLEASEAMGGPEWCAKIPPEPAPDSGDLHDDVPELCRQLVEEKSELERQLGEHKAARMAYASEFPLNADGEPDVGNIHANIRNMKQQLSERQPTAQQVSLASVEDARDAAQFRFLRDVIGWEWRQPRHAGVRPIFRIEFECSNYGWNDGENKIGEAIASLQAGKENASEHK